MSLLGSVIGAFIYDRACRWILTVRTKHTTKSTDAPKPTDMRTTWYSRWIPVLCLFLILLLILSIMRSSGVPIDAIFLRLIDGLCGNSYPNANQKVRSDRMSRRVGLFFCLCWFCAPLSTPAQEDWKYYNGKVIGTSSPIDDGVEEFTVEARAICVFESDLYLYFPVRYASIFPTNERSKTYDLSISFEYEDPQSVHALIYDVDWAVEIVLKRNNISNLLGQYWREEFIVEGFADLGASFLDVTFEIRKYQTEWKKCS